VRDTACVGASRWSWDETVRYAGDGKNGGFGGVGVTLEVVGGVADGIGSVLMRKVSPAPSQSELVIIGVCMKV
jgi:hypothetical protein